MVEKGIRGGICHAIFYMKKTINKYMKKYDKKRTSHLKYLEDNKIQK